jgi:tetraacyldisaccharide 4'-kinase
LNRAGVVCLSRANLLDDGGRHAIRQRVATLAPTAAWCEGAHAPHGLLNSAGQRQPLSALAGRRVAAFCGIGNPAAFRRALETAGCQIAFWREFPDHHAYGAADREGLTSAAGASDAELVICTHKDLVKLPIDELGGRPLWALTVEMEILAGADELEAALDRVARMVAVSPS